MEQRERKMEENKMKKESPTPPPGRLIYKETPGEGIKAIVVAVILAAVITFLILAALKWL